VECSRASDGGSRGEVGGEKCEDVFEVALVGVEPAGLGPVAAGSTLDDTSLTSFCSFSSIKTLAWVGSGSAMFDMFLLSVRASVGGDVGMYRAIASVHHVLWPGLNARFGGCSATV
jgi:hypothetical protein